VNDLSEQVMELLDRIRNRYYGKYRGTVTDVDTQTLRIKARVPAVLHSETTGWCQPCVPYAGDQVGMLFLPEAGDFVWIEFEGGDPSYPIWVGCNWRDGQMPSDAAPAVRIVVTKSGHKLLFDDDAESITVTDPNENEVTLDSSGITLARKGKSVVVSDSDVNINDGGLQVS
jgi:uncharacterized protein involved in type VI secretion and phage assembly